MKISAFIITIVFGLAVFGGIANAQNHDNIIQSLEQYVPGQGRVSIHMDPSVEIIMRQSSQAKTSTSTTGGPTKVMGYRISVYTGGNTNESKKEAEKIAAQVRQRFPDLRTYAYYDHPRPRWVCRVGDFRSYEEAAVTLRRLREAGYRQATIPPTKELINVGYQRTNVNDAD